MPALTETMTRNLIEQIALGNQRAFEELCRAFEKPLFRVAFNILHDPCTANDVMQDVFLAIWEGSRNFRGESKPFTWMFTIARHKAISTLRSNARSVNLAEGVPDADVLKEKPELDAVICQALKKLSVEHRLVIILTYYLKFPQSQIAEILQCPVGTVKSRLSNGLRQLRDLFDTPFSGRLFADSIEEY